MDIKGQEHQQDIEKIKLFRYMDDDFMTVCLEDNYEGVELILQIILQRSDIKVTSIRTQEVMKNLKGRLQFWIFERLIVPPKNMI